MPTWFHTFFLEQVWGVGLLTPSVICLFCSFDISHILKHSLLYPPPFLPQKQRAVKIFQDLFIPQCPPLEMWADSINSCCFPWSTIIGTHTSELVLSVKANIHFHQSHVWCCVMMYPVCNCLALFHAPVCNCVTLFLASVCNCVT